MGAPNLATIIVALALAACNVLAPLSPPPGEPSGEASPVALDAGGGDLPALDAPTCTDPTWWDTRWARRRMLTFDNAAQSEDLKGFPVAVRLDLTQYAATDFLPGGDDVRLVSAAGAELPHEIESWSVSEAIVWVKVPLITAGSSTEHIWLYFANPGATAPAAPPPVWDQHFVGVWHLQTDPTAGPVPDSSQSKNHAANSGLTAADSQPGAIGRGLSFDGSSYLRVASSDSDELAVTTPALTLEGWGLLQVSGNNYYSVVSRLLGTEYKDSFTLVVHDADPTGQPSLDLRFQTTPDSAKSTTAVATGTWQHLAGVRDGQQMRVYIDGKLAGTLTATSSNISTDNHDVLIGANENYTTASEEWSGMLDEVRISTVARSASWIAATYLNGAGLFVKAGPVESCP